ICETEIDYVAGSPHVAGDCVRTRICRVGLRSRWRRRPPCDSEVEVAAGEIFGIGRVRGRAAVDAATGNIQLAVNQRVHAEACEVCAASRRLSAQEAGELRHGCQSILIQSDPGGNRAVVAEAAETL